MTEGRFDDLPKYDELPRIGTLDVKQSWGLLPASLGTLAHLTPERVLTATREAATGQTISLNAPMDTFSPALFGRPAVRHDLLESARNINEDVLNDFNPQASSQWDGLTHIRAREFGYYGGITDDQEARATLGMHHWAERGIVGRGVLLDVAGYRAARGLGRDPFQEETIGPAELGEVAAAHGVEFRSGDILCVRTGWLEEYRSRRESGRDLVDAGDAFIGLESGHEMAAWLWDSRMAAVCSDNPAVESAPGDPRVGSLHRRLLPGLGLPMAELLDLDRLAVNCRETGKYDFLFVAVPLPITGGVSSTSNAVAIL
ncbi:MAG: cyclase family protein [Actinomycetota bacterium]